jgi:hypothetical protein
LRPPWGRRKGGAEGVLSGRERVWTFPASHLRLGEEGGSGAGAPGLGKSGRVNAVAHLERRSCGGWGGLGYALLEGRCGGTGAYPSRYSPHLNPVERSDIGGG